MAGYSTLPSITPALYFRRGDLINGGLEDRAPEDTRPLALSNSDNKMLASLVALPLQAVASQSAHEAQRGFARGRGLIAGVVGQDGHLFGWGAIMGHRRTAGSCFDFRVAFPSV
eukprot:2650857-Pyramimonas_sp.AAC.1